LLPGLGRLDFGVEGRDLEPPQSQTRLTPASGWWICCIARLLPDRRGRLRRSPRPGTERRPPVAAQFAGGYRLRSRASSGRSSRRSLSSAARGAGSQRCRRRLQPGSPRLMCVGMSWARRQRPIFDGNRCPVVGATGGSRLRSILNRGTRAGTGWPRCWIRPAPSGGDAASYRWIARPRKSPKGLLRCH
jgi:hypothetical protein